MKKLSLLTIVALIAVSLSCDKIKTPSITFTEEVTLPDHAAFLIDEGKDEPENPYPDSRVLDITLNEEIEKYADKIEKIKVNSIKYVITNFQAEDEVVFDGESTFEAEDGLGGSVLAEVHGLTLTNMNGILTVDQAGFETLGDILLDKKKVKIISSSTISSSPVSFNLNYVFNVTITTKPL